MIAYSTPKPITPLTCCSPLRPNAMYSATRPVTRCTMLCTASVRTSALSADPTSEVLRKPSRPTATRTIPARVAQPIAVFVLFMKSVLRSWRIDASIHCAETRAGVPDLPPRDGSRQPAVWMTDRSSRAGGHDVSIDTASTCSRARGASTNHRRDKPRGTSHGWREAPPRMAGMPATNEGARFVGRDAAFIRLAPALETAASGEATTALLAGPGGVGVSRFIDEVSKRVGALADPFAVVRGRAYRPGADEPYGPIIRALRPIFERTSDDELLRLLGPAVEDVARLFPEVQARAAVLGALPDRPTTTAPERRQGRVLEALLGVIGRLSEHEPVLVVLEDLHDADAGTRALVTFLARVRRAHRLCFVG